MADSHTDTSQEDDDVVSSPFPMQVDRSYPLLYSNNRETNWHFLKERVKELHKELTGICSRVPTNFTFRTVQTLDGEKTRLYFLGTTSNFRENTLLYVDIPNSPGDVRLNLCDWYSLLDFRSFTSPGTLSKEEQLMRERQRLAVFGITSYDINLSDGQILFPAVNSLLVCCDKISASPEPLTPDHVETSCSDARIDAKLCPSDSSLIAFVHHNDLWVTSLKSGQECRLTSAHTGVDMINDPLSAGVPSFVSQEEFDRYTAYWWEPVTHDPEGRCHRILYEEIDEEFVEIIHLFAPMTDSGQGVDQYRYPRAGTANAKSNLKLIEFEVGQDDQIQENFVEKQLYEPLGALFPWMEYLVRAGWTPDAKYVYIQILDRRQCRLVLAIIPVECFVPVTSDPEMELSYYQEASSYPPIQVIYEDTSNVWINVVDMIHFFPQTSPREITFLWSSEQTGFRHLYKVTSAIQHCDNPLRQSASEQIEYDNKILEASIINHLALTKGDWEVLGKQIWVDEKRYLVYFMALKDSPLETHLYVVNYMRPGEPLCLTQRGFSHAVSLSIEHSMFVTMYSSIQQPPTCEVHRIVHDDKGKVTIRVKALLMAPSVCPVAYEAPELFQFTTSDNVLIHGMFFRPLVGRSRTQKKYPLVNMVYGGPQVQQVTNSFKGSRYLRHYTLAAQGYAVVVIDNRGSCHRGLHFEGYVKNRLGQVEISDQVEGIQHLESMTGMIDMGRIAIHGWSYGGYLSLLGLAQRPDIFKVAIAGAPVTTWHLYDTGYTERYMMTPSENPEGYNEGMVSSHVDSFPNEENRLLIIHGLVDENVHFQHSSVLINALIKAGKPYAIQVYPNERHGIRNHEASEHYKTMILSFLQKNL